MLLVIDAIAVFAKASTVISHMVKVHASFAAQRKQIDSNGNTKLLGLAIMTSPSATLTPR